MFGRCRIFLGGPRGTFIFLRTAIIDVCALPLSCNKQDGTINHFCNWTILEFIRKILRLTVMQSDKKSFRVDVVFDSVNTAYWDEDSI